LDRQLEEIVHRSFIDEYRVRLNETGDALKQISSQLLERVVRR